MLQSFIESEAGSIGYERIGSGPVILFIHGLTYDRRMWRPLIGRLKNDFTCIAVDLPGYGKSADAQTYDLETVTRTIYNAVNVLDIEEPILVGHAMGALYAVAYAAKYPTAGLVTSDHALPNIALLQRLHGMRPALQSPALTSIWHSIVRQLGIGLVAQPQRALVQPASNPRHDVVLGYWREALEAPPVWQARLIDHIRRIDVPFSAIFGNDDADDDFLGLRTIEPFAKVVVFRTPGHLHPLVEVDRFAHEVRAVARKTACACAASDLVRRTCTTDDDGPIGGFVEPSRDEPIRPNAIDWSSSGSSSAAKPIRSETNL